MVLSLARIKEASDGSDLRPNTAKIGRTHTDVEVELKGNKTDTKDKKNKTNKTDTKQPTDEIDLNPPLTDHEGDGARKVVEVLSVQQRRKRAIQMRRHKHKIVRGKKRFKKRRATQAMLKRRAQQGAIRAVRAKVAGDRGKNYKQLSPADRIMIDKRVKMKSALIKRLSKRMLPQARKKELARLSGARANKTEGFDVDAVDIIDRTLDTFNPYQLELIEQVLDGESQDFETGVELIESVFKQIDEGPQIFALIQTTPKDKMVLAVDTNKNALNKLAKNMSNTGAVSVVPWKGGDKALKVPSYVKQDLKSYGVNEMTLSQFASDDAMFGGSGSLPSSGFMKTKLGRKLAHTLQGSEYEKAVYTYLKARAKNTTISRSHLATQISREFRHVTPRKLLAHLTKMVKKGMIPTTMVGEDAKNGFDFEVEAYGPTEYGTDHRTDRYKKETPGQEKMSIVRKGKAKRTYVKEATKKSYVEAKASYTKGTFGSKFKRKEVKYKLARKDWMGNQVHGEWVMAEIKKTSQHKSQEKQGWRLEKAEAKIVGEGAAEPLPVIGRNRPMQTELTASQNRERLLKKIKKNVGHLGPYTPTKKDDNPPKTANKTR